MSPRASLRWVVTENVEDAYRLREEYDLDVKCTTPEHVDQALSDPSVEAVMIVTPTPMHETLIKKSLNAGLIIFRAFPFLSGKDPTKLSPVKAMYWPISQVLCDKTQFSVDNKPRDQVYAAGETGSEEPRIEETFLSRYSDAYRLELDHFLDVLEGKAELLITKNEVIQAMRLAELCKQSFGAQRVVQYVD